MPNFPPFPKFNLHDPCAADSDNLIKNGSMGPAHHDTPFGAVVNGWEPFVFGGDLPRFQSLEQAVHARSNAAKPWMPVNNGAALWNLPKQTVCKTNKATNSNLFVRAKNICVRFSTSASSMSSGRPGKYQVIRK